MKNFACRTATLQERWCHATKSKVASGQKLLTNWWYKAAYGDKLGKRINRYCRSKAYFQWIRATLCTYFGKHRSVSQGKKPSRRHTSARRKSIGQALLGQPHHHPRGNQATGRFGSRRAPPGNRHIRGGKAKSDIHMVDRNAHGPEPGQPSDRNRHSACRRS